MDINITLLGRTAIDAPFAELSSAVVTLTGDSVAFAPAISAAAAAMELMLRVLAPDTVKIDVGRWLVPAPAGEEPGPDPWVRGSYVAFINSARDIPWRAGDSLLIARPGTVHQGGSPEAVYVPPSQPSL